MNHINVYGDRSLGFDKSHVLGKQDHYDNRRNNYWRNKKLTLNMQQEAEKIIAEASERLTKAAA